VLIFRCMSSVRMPCCVLLCAAVCCCVLCAGAGKVVIRNMADKKTVEEVDTLIATRSAHEGAVSKQHYHIYTRHAAPPPPSVALRRDSVKSAYGIIVSVRACVLTGMYMYACACMCHVYPTTAGVHAPIIAVPHPSAGPGAWLCRCGAENVLLRAILNECTPIILPTRARDKHRKEKLRNCGMFCAGACQRDQLLH
jgi:hypothetical protein